MPQISYDFSDAAEGGDFVTLENGLYVFELVKVEAGKSKSNQPKAVVTLKVTGASGSNEVYMGGIINQHWPTKGKAAFRFRSFLAALGVSSKDKGSVKIEKYYGDEIGARVTTTPGSQPDESGNYMMFNELNGLIPGEQARKMLGLLDDDDDEEEEEAEEEEEDEEEDVEEDEEEEDEDEEDDEEDDDEEEDEEDEEEEEYLTLDDLKTMKLPELKELAEENDISIKPPKGKKLTVAIMRKRLAALFEDEEGDEEDEEEDPF